MAINIIKDSRLESIEEIKNYFIKEKDQNELVRKELKKIPAILNYNEHVFILASAVTGCISISAFASLLSIPIVITSSAIGLKNNEITAGIKKYRSQIKK